MLTSSALVSSTDPASVDILIFWKIRAFGASGAHRRPATSGSAECGPRFWPGAAKLEGSGGDKRDPQGPLQRETARSAEVARNPNWTRIPCLLSAVTLAARVRLRPDASAFDLALSYRSATRFPCFFRETLRKSAPKVDESTFGTALIAERRMAPLRRCAGGEARWCRRISPTSLLLLLLPTTAAFSLPYSPLPSSRSAMPHAHARLRTLPTAAWGRRSRVGAVGAVAMRGAKTDVKQDGEGGIQSYYEVRWRGKTSSVSA